MFLVLLPRTKIDLQELFIVLVKEVVILLIPKLNAIRYLGFGMHEAAAISIKIYKLLFYNG